MGGKIDKFCGNGIENFEAWWVALEYLFRKEKIPASEQCEAIVMHLTGKALEWYAELRRDDRIPEDAVELKNMMAKKFDKTREEVFTMKGGDVKGYVRSLERLFLMVPGISDDAKKELFIDGLNPSLYSLMANLPGGYAKLKQFALDLSERMEQAEITNVFRARAEERPCRRRTFNDEERRLYDERKCFLCKKPGHLKRDCPENPRKSGNSRDQH